MGAKLAREAACQPAWLSQSYPIPLWERACSRRRPNSQPDSPAHTPIRPVGAKLARDSGPSGNINTDCSTAIASKLAPTLVLRHAQKTNTHRNPLWERACSRRRPTSQPDSPAHTPIRPVGAKLARDSGPSGNINTDCSTAIASKPAPTLFLRHAQKSTFTAAPPCGSKACSR